MANDETLLISPKDASSIVKLQDPTIIEQLLENPPAVLAELLAGWFATGNGFLGAAGCRIAQAAFKGRVFEQFAREFRYLRQQGKISDDFQDKKYGSKSWVELLTILDEEIPDEDRLDALKAMFYSVNRVNLTDGEKIANYQLFQIARKLTSGQLLLLNAAFQRTKEGGFQTYNMTYQWIEEMSRRLGHKIVGLIEQDEKVLVENGLLSRWLQIDMSGVNDKNGRLTVLAVKFCENIESYHFDLSDAERING